MGFFSWNCKGCNESIKAPYDIPEGIEWQNEAVWLREEEEPIIGEYDGYGRVGAYDMQEMDIGFGDDPELWHKKCWDSAGKPEYSSVSDYAEDQGFFYGDDCSVEDY